MRGCVVPLDPGVQLTAYRIVQEALTNARRHAPGAAVGRRAGLHRRGSCGCGSATTARVPPVDQDGTDGHGLVGMRERAAMVGGTLTDGRSPGGGFVVEAVLPIPPDEP